MDWQEMYSFFLEFWFEVGKFWVIVIGASVPIKLVFNFLISALTSLVNQGKHL